MATEQTHLQECIQLCWQCRDTCQDTLFNHNLSRGGTQLDPDNIRIMTDCMEICQAAADFMRRNSPLHTVTCGACAQICNACADSCENMGKEHAAIQHCAQICRKCAKSCEAMGTRKKAA
jgi:hypothetical protein